MKNTKPDTIKTDAPAFRLQNIKFIERGAAKVKFDIEIPNVITLVGAALIEKQNGLGYWLAAQSSTYDHPDGKRTYLPSARFDPALASAVVEAAEALYLASQSGN